MHNSSAKSQSGLGQLTIPTSGLNLRFPWPTNASSNQIHLNISWLLPVGLKRLFLNSNVSDLKSLSVHFSEWVDRQLQTDFPNYSDTDLKSKPTFIQTTISTSCLIPVQQVFNTILSSVNGLILLSTNSQDSNLTTEGNKENPINMHVRSRKSTTPASKRSARLQAKKVKMLGSDEVSVCSEDVFTINSLTANDIRILGSKCGFIFSTADDEAIQKLKQLELARCKFAPNEPAC
ncbi:hypothetical protein COCNU_scaffold003491G000010 [Cocos nucifera]|nr:hypothetical protein [Cocos nucifera]